MDFEGRRLLQQRLRELIAPTVEREGYELVAVEYTGTESGPVVRVSIDHPEGVDVADCADVSLAVSPLLDVDDPVPGAYRLEVSSPGMQRPLQRLEDFGRFAGFLVKIRLAPTENRRNFKGVLKGVEDGRVVVEVDGVTHRFDPVTVERAHLDPEFQDFERLRDVTRGLGGTPS